MKSGQEASVVRLNGPGLAESQHLPEPGASCSRHPESGVDVIAGQPEGLAKASTAERTSGPDSPSAHTLNLSNRRQAGGLARYPSDAQLVRVNHSAVLASAQGRWWIVERAALELGARCCPADVRQHRPKTPRGGGFRHRPLPTANQAASFQALATA